MKDDSFKIDFVGIGAPKCATTWIYECLQEHPQLCLAPKDQEKTAYFLKSEHSKEELEKYKALFNSKKCKLKGDFYVWYLYNEKALYRMKEHNPNLKIIVCLRNPIDMLYSLSRYSAFTQGKKWESVEQMIEERPAVVRAGFYYRHLKKYLDTFPRENILILIYEDIKKNPVAFIQKIYKFLGVNANFIPPSVNLKINPTDFKLTGLGKFFHGKIVKFFLKHSYTFTWRIKRSPLVKKLVCKFSTLYLPKKKQKGILPETRSHLIEIYKRDIAKLEKLLNRDLSFWKK